MSEVQGYSFFFFTPVTGPRRSLSLKLSDAKIYEPQIRARLGNHNTTILGFCRNSLLTLEPFDLRNRRTSYSIISVKWLILD